MVAICGGGIFGGGGGDVLEITGSDLIVGGTGEMDGTGDTFGLKLGGGGGNGFGGDGSFGNGSFGNETIVLYFSVNCVASI